MPSYPDCPGTTWYDIGEIQHEALHGKRQPEFSPADRPADPEDRSWEATTTMIDRINVLAELAAATRLATYLLEDGTTLLMEDGTALLLEDGT